MKQREYRILELLTERKRIEVAALAREIGVSQVTVRKDLDALEEKGVIHREHGWAVLCSPDDLNGRIAYHYEAKRRIAARAAELVRDGETVMIESGSCCALLADALTPCLHKPAFGSMALAYYAKTQGYEEVELCGLVSNICVISNAVLVKAALPEARVSVDARCTACADPAMNEKALDVMEGLQVAVTNR